MTCPPGSRRRYCPPGHSFNFNLFKFSNFKKKGDSRYGSIVGASDVAVERQNFVRQIQNSESIAVLRGSFEMRQGSESHPISDPPTIAATCATKITATFAAKFTAKFAAKFAKFAKFAKNARGRRSALDGIIPGRDLGPHASKPTAPGGHRTHRRSRPVSDGEGAVAPRDSSGHGEEPPLR